MIHTALLGATMGARAILPYVAPSTATAATVWGAVGGTAGRWRGYDLVPRNIEHEVVQPALDAVARVRSLHPDVQGPAIGEVCDQNLPPAHTRGCEVRQSAGAGAPDEPRRGERRGRAPRQGRALGSNPERA